MERGDTRTITIHRTPPASGGNSVGSVGSADDPQMSRRRPTLPTLPTLD